MTLREWLKGVKAVAKDVKREGQAVQVGLCQLESFATCRLFKTLYFVVSDLLTRANKLQRKLKGGGKSGIEEDTSDLVLVNLISAIILVYVYCFHRSPFVK